jgi:hypothetical protein
MKFGNMTITRSRNMKSMRTRNMLIIAVVMLALFVPMFFLFYPDFMRYIQMRSM